MHFVRFRSQITYDDVDYFLLKAKYSIEIYGEFSQRPDVQVRVETKIIL